ncbi:MAG: VRR-NUC domain-containing protein [Actinobacteria bacterium]|nr:VRR-NUC domain-containing protein [Actinomycetota bacterium]
MAQAEARLSRKIMEALRAEGYFCFKVHGSEYMMAGLPDIIVCAEGLFIGLETKRTSTRSNVSPRQEYVHELIRTAGGTAAVICSPAEALIAVKTAIAAAKQA